MRGVFVTTYYINNDVIALEKSTVNFVKSLDSNGENYGLLERKREIPVNVRIFRGSINFLRQIFCSKRLGQEVSRRPG